MPIHVSHQVQLTCHKVKFSLELHRTLSRRRNRFTYLAAEKPWEIRAVKSFSGAFRDAAKSAEYYAFPRVLLKKNSRVVCTTWNV